MHTHIQNFPRCGALMMGAVTFLAMSLTGCIHAKDQSGGGSTTPGGGIGVTSCTNVSSTPYRGGDALGEELTVTISAATTTTLSYKIVIDASAQRTPGTPAAEINGTLTQLTDCHFSSEEAGAVFTFGADGVVQGGVRDIAGTKFAPMLAFNTTFTALDPATTSNPNGTFSTVALTLNAFGVQTTTGVTTGYGGNARIRNAGTIQFCPGYLTNATNCAGTERGYFTFSDTRNAFDYFATTGSTLTTTGGTAAGSMIIGMVNSVYVPLFLRRVSATDYGMRLLTNQVSTASGAADGTYQVVDSGGSNASATWSGSSFTRATDVTMLTYDSSGANPVVPPAATAVPILGLIQVTPVSPSTLTGYMATAGGVYGFVPTSSGSAVFEMGLKEQ